MIDVVPGGPAARAGLKGVDRRTQGLGDVIVAVDGTPINTAPELSKRLESIGIGNEATLTVERAGQRRQVVIDIVDIG